MTPPGAPVVTRASLLIAAWSALLLLAVAQFALSWSASPAGSQAREQVRDAHTASSGTPLAHQGSNGGAWRGLRGRALGASGNDAILISLPKGQLESKMGHEEEEPLMRSGAVGGGKVRVGSGEGAKAEQIGAGEEDGEPMVAEAVGVDALSLIAKEKLWKSPSARGYVPCVDPSKGYASPALNWTRGFLTVHTNGGLNQMRAGICDIVAIARILNATLVVPDLDKSSFWNDTSTFSDIFDTDHFISSLKHDVPVLRKLPKRFKLAPVKRVHFKSWSSLHYYRDEVGAFWKQYKVIRALKSDSRLVNNGLPPDIQKLRCRVHFHALRFSPAIESLGKELVRRMSKDGPFIALHLRYEADMLAFTGCTHGLTDAESRDITNMRLATKQWREKNINAAEQRAKGLCPLTPHEVGVFLSALGFPNQTRIYIAAGEIFGGKEREKDLRKFFPKLERKETLATKEELGALAVHQNAMAALDFLVAVGSDVFVSSYSGNMARAVEGHRRFEGHRNSITPDRVGLARLFGQLERGEVQIGPTFSERVALLHLHRMGAPRPRKVAPRGIKRKELGNAEESFYSNPLPDCLCKSDKYEERRGQVRVVRPRRGKDIVLL